jgi:hypothetical protein
VYAWVISEKASSRRARQFIGGVSWPESSVQVRQTTQQVVVQRFGLTSDRKAAPRPPVPAASPKVNKAAFFTRGALRLRAQNQAPSSSAHQDASAEK